MIINGHRRLYSYHFYFWMIYIYIYIYEVNTSTLGARDSFVKLRFPPSTLLNQKCLQNVEPTSGQVYFLAIPHVKSLLIIKIEFQKLQNSYNFS